MIVSLPANPVGSVGTPELYEEIIAFACEHDLLIVHDNAYSDIVYDGPAGGSFLSYPGALEVGVEFFSLSKSFNVTGARIGFLVGRADVVAAFAKLRSQIDFGMFFPIQKAAIAALTGSSTSAISIRSAATRSATGSRRSVGSVPTRTVRCSCGRSFPADARIPWRFARSLWSARAWW